MSLPMQADEAGELASAAARAQRRNRPMSLVVLGAIALVVGAIIALTGWSAHRDARSRVDRAKDNAEKMLELGATLKAMQDAEAAAGGPRLVESPTNVLSRIEAAGPRAGLKKPVGVGTRSSIPDRATGWSQTRYAYNVKDESLGSLVGWAEQVTKDLPGVEVSSVSIRPEASEWAMTVVFTRWERTEGS
jgi:hypothetical protein